MRVAQFGPDYFNYGMGPEWQFYTTKTVPAAAQGGYFDADAYFADGGPVDVPNPPTQDLGSSMPTMAYTDGQGAVGSIAAPPGLSNSDSYGSDVAHASPMAPSPAAAAPQLNLGPLSMGAYNTNASPVQSQIAQNPNMSYSLGLTPLSRLKG